MADKIKPHHDFVVGQAYCQCKSFVISGQSRCHNCGVELDWSTWYQEEQRFFEENVEWLRQQKGKYDLF